MSKLEKSKNYVIWKNDKIGKPPQRREFILDYDKISKAILSFDIDLRETHSRLDPAQPILINDKMVQNLDLPVNPKSKSLQAIDRKNVNVTTLVKTSTSGEKNIIEVNYLLGKISPAVALLPGFKAGMLSLEITVFFQWETDGKGGNGEKMKYCMWCGRSILKGSVVCSFCERHPPEGGQDPKKCNHCGHPIPRVAVYCGECGHKQPVDESPKICPKCTFTVPSNAHFCPNCGHKQTSLEETAGNKIYCINCGEELAAGYKFCPKCSTPQP